MIQTGCTYGEFYFDFYCISSTSDHQALNPRDRGPDIGDLFYSFVVLATVSSWNVERAVLDAVGDTEVWAWVLGSVRRVSRSV